MTFTLSQLRSFLAVAEAGHFGKAAESLHLTQPSLTRNVQNLEKSLKVSLLTRGGKSVTLTAAGQAVLEDAKRILSIADATPERAKLAASGELGSLKLAFTAMGAYAVLPDVLSLISDKQPGLSVTMSELVSEEQFAALERGTLDLAIARPPIPANVASHLIHSEEMVVALPSNHPQAASVVPLLLQEVLAGDFIAYNQQAQRYFHDTCATMLNVDQFLLTHSVSEIPAMLALVRAGRGIAVVPVSATLLGVHGVVFKQLDPLQTRQVSLYLCWNEHNSNPALQRLLPAFENLRVQSSVGVS